MDGQNGFKPRNSEMSKSNLVIRLRLQYGVDVAVSSGCTAWPEFFQHQSDWYGQVLKRQYVEQICDAALGVSALQHEQKPAQRRENQQYPHYRRAPFLIIFRNKPENEKRQKNNSHTDKRGRKFCQDKLGAALVGRCRIDKGGHEHRQYGQTERNRGSENDGRIAKNTKLIHENSTSC